MDDFELKRIIYDYIKEICHYSQMQVFATSSYQKNYFQFQIDDATNGLINFIQENNIGRIEKQSYTAQQLPNQQGRQIMGNQAVQEQVPSRQTEQNQQPMQEGLEMSVLERQSETEQELELERLLQEEQQELNRTIVPQKSLRLTKEQLAYYDGSDGRPAYTAVSGVIYNMTDIIQWGGGTHFGLYAGEDLTNVFMKCHNGMIEVLAKVPQVGTLIT